MHVDPAGERLVLEAAGGLLVCAHLEDVASSVPPILVSRFPLAPEEIWDVNADTLSLVISSRTDFIEHLFALGWMGWTHLSCGWS